MLPLLPFAPYTRPAQFVREEWQAFFASSAAANVTGGWKGILYANLALVDPQASWRFFAQREFDASWIDGGASRAWYLAFAAGEFFFGLFLGDVFCRARGANEGVWCCRVGGS